MVCWESELVDLTWEDTQADSQAQDDCNTVLYPQLIYSRYRSLLTAAVVVAIYNVSQDKTRKKLISSFRIIYSMNLLLHATFVQFVPP